MSAYLGVNASLFQVFPKKTNHHHPKVSVKNRIALFILDHDAA
jgi:hypothetical protein